MKTKHVLIIWGILFFPSTFIFSQENEMNASDSIKSTIENYYTLNIKIMGGSGTASDIDELFRLFTDDFVYVHEKYGGEYSRETLYNGYQNNLKRGGYDGSVIYIEVEKMIIGLNVAAVEKRFISKDKEGNVEKGAPEMTFFELRKGKIAKITEYW